MRSFPLLLLVLSGLLFGCSNAPLSVALRDFDVDVAAVQSNKIVFVKQSFDRPPVSLSRVELEGNLTYKTGFAFSFFARIYKPPYPNQALQLCLEHEPPCLPIGRP